MSSGAEHIDRPPVGRRHHESLDEQVRRRGLKPIKSVDDLVCEGIFDTDEELDAFLAWYRAERQADLALRPVDHVVLDTDVASRSFRRRLPAGCVFSASTAATSTRARTMTSRT
jgi:hypothetical protein